MALLVVAGMEGWAWRLAHSRDPVEVQVGQAVAERALALRTEIVGKRLEILERNVGVHVGNAVGKVLGPVLGKLPENIARALGAR